MFWKQISSAKLQVGRHPKMPKTLTLRSQNALPRAAHPSWLCIYIYVIHYNTHTHIYIYTYIHDRYLYVYMLFLILLDHTGVGSSRHFITCVIRNSAFRHA